MALTLIKNDATTWGPEANAINDNFAQMPLGVVGKNLFNKDTIVTGYINLTTGGITADASYRTSDYIAVVPGSRYRKSYFNGTSQAALNGRLAYYDASKVFVSKIDNDSHDITVPANCYFLRFSTSTVTIANAAQVELGSAITTLTAFAISINGSKIVDESILAGKLAANAVTTTIIADGSITSAKLATTEKQKYDAVNSGLRSKNIFNKNTVIADYRLSGSTGALIGDAGYSTSDWIDCLPSTEYIHNYKSTVLAFYTSEKVFISIVSLDWFYFTTPANAYYMRKTVLTTQVDTAQIELGHTATDYTPWELNWDGSEILDKTIGNEKLKDAVVNIAKIDSTFADNLRSILDSTVRTTVELLVDAAGTIGVDGVTHNSIRAAIKSLPATLPTYTRYHIFVKNGTYNEIDINGANYNGLDRNKVVVEGQSRTGVIIITDGASTVAVPADYSVTGHTGAAFNTLDPTLRVCFSVVQTVTFKNLTIWSKNDTRYCVHQDDPGNYDSLFENCHFIYEVSPGVTVRPCIGNGVRYLQIPRYWDCIFEVRGVAADTGQTGVYMHNILSQIGGMYAEIINGRFINCAYLSAGDLGSGQSDRILLKNCTSDSQLNGVQYILQAPLTSADDPYCITVDIVNTKVNAFVMPDTRSKAGIKCLDLNNYHYKVYNDSGATIAPGTAVKRDWTKTLGKKCIIKAVDNDFDFVVWGSEATGFYGTGIVNGEYGFAVPKGGKRVQCIPATAVSGDYVKGGWVKVNSDGKFAVTTTLSERIGILVRDGIIQGWIDITI